MDTIGKSRSLVCEVGNEFWVVPSFKLANQPWEREKERKREIESMWSRKWVLSCT